MRRRAGRATTPAAPARDRRFTGTFVLLCVAAAVLLLPVVWSVSTSLKSPADVFLPGLGLIPWHPTLDAYRSVFGAVPFARYLFNSLVVTTAIVVLNVLFDSCAAYAFAKLRFPGRSAMFGLLLVTLMIPMQVNLIPLYRMMVWIHLRVPVLGADTLSGIIAPSAVQVFGIFLMRQFFASIPDAIIEAARLDGASELTILRRVILPLARPGLATLTIFTLLRSWNDFLWPLITINNVDSKTLPLGMTMFFTRVAGQTPWNQVMAAATFSVIPVLVLFILGQRYYVKGIATSGIKG